jgi:hypothetical protein
VAGKYTRSELSDSLQLTALDGTLLLVTVNMGQVYVNGMKLGNEISVGKSVVHIVEGAIPAEPPAQEKPNVSVMGLMLSQSSVTLEAGKTEHIAMLFQPINATNQKVTWQIDKPEVVKVTAINSSIDSLFTITAIATGTANILFTTIDGGYTANCTVTVTDTVLDDNEENGIIEEGLYSGIFTATYVNIVDIQAGDTIKNTIIVSRTITLELINDKFICTDYTEGVPSANGFGSYSIKNDIIIFNDENVRTAERTWDWILDGEYKFTINAKQLMFSKGIYEYDLIKQ